MNELKGAPVSTVPFPNSSNRTSERLVALRSERDTWFRSIMNADCACYIRLSDMKPTWAMRLRTREIDSRV